MKNKLTGVLVTGLALGTAWAVRGHFGHEQGAAWAGTIGALTMVLVSGRKDWYQKIFPVALSAALGWGATGMISYGIVVGYGRSTGFVNALYGLSMLFVIGGLFGLLGGGLAGLSLESTKEKKVKWAGLISEMVAGGLITYSFLIQQLNLLMTPPRSEAWALCLGAGLAMIWYMARHNYRSALRVALCSALGAGFGFAFGNFLQILGNVLEINFNMWNVMEYSIGFFGGSAFAYSVFSSQWPETETRPAPWKSRTAFLILFIFVPLIVFKQSFAYNILLNRLKDVATSENTALFSSLFAALLMAVAALMVWLRMEKAKFCFQRRDVFLFFLVCFSAYIAMSYIVSGIFAGKSHLNIHLYVLNLLVILFLLRKKAVPFSAQSVPGINYKKLILYVLGIILVIVILALIAVNIHGELNGAHDRFQIKM